MLYRYAVYFVPERNSALYTLGSALLGYDIYTGHAVPGPDMPLPEGLSLERLTEEPRRYGLHATVLAPFFLADITESQLIEETAGFCRRTPGVMMPRVVLELYRGFYALRPALTEKHERLAYACLLALAGRAVCFYKPLQAPLEKAELQRRGAGLRSPRQRAYLERWGYPYVFDEYDFHITLTGRVDEEKAPALQNPLGSHLAPVLGLPLAVRSLCLCRQCVTLEEKAHSRYSTPFVVLSYFPLADEKGM